MSLIYIGTADWSLTLGWGGFL